MSPIIPRTPVRHTSLYALFLTAALLAGVNGSTTHTAKPRTAAAGPSLTVTTLHASRDSFIRAGADDTNEGANERLHLHNSGDSRAVVSFDLTGITTAGLQSATLVLTVAEDSHTWGADGRAVDAHRLLADWAEGDGRNDVSVGGGPGTRGSGAGVTWNCAADADISDHASDCGSPWDGGLYAAATSPGVAHTNDLAGEVSWDVTADLLAGADFGWLIRKRREDRGGRVRYYSREGAAVAGDAALAPRLVLVYQTAAPAGRAYVANYSSNDVSVIDTSTNSVAATIPVGATAHAVALTPDGTRAYVANFGSHDVSVIDTTTNAVVATVAAGTNPRDIAVNSAGTRVYITNFEGHSLSVIDAATNTVTATVAAGINPVGVAVR